MRRTSDDPRQRDQTVGDQREHRRGIIRQVDLLIVDRRLVDQLIAISVFYAEPVARR